MRPRGLALSPFLTGDPRPLGPEVDSLAALGAAVGLEPDERPGLLPLGPDGVLVHVLRRPAGSLSLAWVRLPHRPVLAPGLPPAAFAVILTAPLREIGRALRLVGRLRACLAVCGLPDRLAAATTREDLAAALAAAEEAAGEGRLTAAEVLALLGSSPGGLGGAEVAARRAAVGPNRLERVRRRPLLLRLLEQFWSFFAALLWVGSALAWLAGMPELAWAIVAVIVVNGIGSFLQEYRAERAIETLQQLLPRHVTVLRDGAEVRVPAAELVPGDVVRLEEGVQVPADGQLLEATDLRVDQSALTGEAQPVFKHPVTGGGDHVPRLERPELVFAGTSVMAGAGLLVVTATGMATEIGGIARLTQAVPETPSPLQREMGRVTRLVTALAVACGTGFFLLGVATGALGPHQGFLFALGIIVANVPEGLLPTLTLALALGVQRMARQRALVRRLSAVETLGATTVICTDKTGTLTEGRMVAHAAWVEGRVVDLRGPGAGGAALEALLAAAVLASQATRERGDPTEVALVAAAEGLGLDAAKLRAAHPLREAFPFDSFRKRMTLVREGPAGTVAYVKGAPRETLALCEAIRWDGRNVPLDRARREALLADHDRLAAEGLRILAVAERRVDRALRGQPAAAVERGLTVLGLVALRDPPRPEVPGAIALCRRAGIRVVVVTGDYGLTARAIAREIGLPVTQVVTGAELDRLAPEALRGLVTRPGLLVARASPAHKLAIVEALRAAGEVVAVTGDGVNDAPALRGADIGVAMGQRGSDVAREAAVMVLADDNFASIVTAVRLGRAVYANVGKFITYIFASNVPELVPFLAFVFCGIPLPLTVMQILAVDLGTDLLPALALGAEPPEPDVMDRPPRPRGERLLGARRLLHAYGFLGVTEAALALGAFFWTYWRAGWRPGLPLAGEGPLYRRATTMTLAGIVAAQVGNVFACRTDRISVFRAGLGSNPLVLVGVAVEVALLAALILLPPLARVFGLAPPGPGEWGPLLLFPPAMLLLEEGRKWALRHRRAPGRPRPEREEGR